MTGSLRRRVTHVGIPRNARADTSTGPGRRELATRNAQRRVPNHVPDPVDLTPSYSDEPDEASLKRRENERQRANHNPRVGGSSPSSGIKEAPQMGVSAVLGLTGVCRAGFPRAHPSPFLQAPLS
jgi:hypothetical protein